MRRAKQLFCMLIILHAITVAGQTRTDLREIFASAEGDVLFEDYSEALPKYLNLLQYYPDNYNLYFRIGQCYINTPGEKDKAIPYLETAAENIDPGYHEGRLKETGAPYDALYYLANAYRINNQLDKALEAYQKFMNNIDPDIYDTAVVSFQIRSCRIARRMMDNPVYLVERNMGSKLNDRFSEIDPVVSADESVIVFTRALQFYDAVFYSKKINGQWTQPVNMTPQLGVDQDYFSSSLSSDGTTLVLYRTDNYEGNIYMSRYVDDRWTTVEKLNGNINTKYWESHATVSHDGKRLWFASNRKGGYGGLDIYYAERDSTGDWGIPVNAGPVINTRYNEDTPFLSQNDKTLYFSSRGHYNMGGYDIFYSRLNANGEWTEPVNMGYPVNTTDDDLFYSPVGDGHIGFYSKFSSQGFGRMDIFRYEVFSDAHPRNFTVIGKASIRNLLDEFPQSVRVNAESIKDKDVAFNTLTNPETGRYTMRMPHGTFSFSYSAEGAGNINKYIDLPLTHKGDTIMLDNIMLPNTDFTADLRVTTDTSVSLSTTQPVMFNLIVEPKALLEIKLWANGSLLESERYRLTDTLFNFEMMPHDGENKVLFQLTDRFGNMTTASVNLNLSDSTKITPPQYAQIISQRQIETLLETLKKYADDDVRAILDQIDTSEEQFATSDDLIAYIKEKAKDRNIDSSVIDKLALEVALREGILTQAAADLLASKTEGRTRETLDNLNIYDVKVRSWNDLTDYVEKKTSGEMTSEKLRQLAEYILMDPEEGIMMIRERALYAGSLTPENTVINEVVGIADANDYKYTGEYLLGISAEGANKEVDLTVSKIKAAIAHKPGESALKLLSTLNDNSGDRLKLFLNSIDLKRAGIRSPEDLIIYLDAAVKAGAINARDYNDALATTIINAALTESEIKENMSEKCNYCWLLWVAGAALLFILLLLLFRRKKKKDEEKKDSDD